MIFGAAIWGSWVLYSRYGERVVFLEVPLAVVGFFPVAWFSTEGSEPWRGLIILLYLGGLCGYCVWRAERRSRLKAVRKRQELEREYLAHRKAQEYENAKSLAMTALGEFPNVGAVEYYAHYSHIRDTIVKGLSNEEVREWDRRWRMRLGDALALRRGQARVEQVCREDQVTAAVAFDENNKARIALSKDATFEDLMNALYRVDPGIKDAQRSLTPRRRRRLDRRRAAQ